MGIKSSCSSSRRSKSLTEYPPNYDDDMEDEDDYERRRMAVDHSTGYGRSVDKTLL